MQESHLTDLSQEGAHPMSERPTTLEHRVLLPEGRGAEKYPTVVMLHGRGADEEDLIPLAEQYDPRLLVLSVRAPFPFPNGATPDPVTFRQSYDRLSQFIDDALGAYPVDPSRVFLLGFSMGTVMAYAVSLTRPGLFRGVIANSGYVPEGTHLEFRWNELRNVAFFVAHGKEDPVIPVDLARRAQVLFASSNAAVTYREYDMGHQITQESIRDSSLFLDGLLANPRKG